MWLSFSFFFFHVFPLVHLLLDIPGLLKCFWSMMLLYVAMMSLACWMFFCLLPSEGKAVRIERKIEYHC